MNGVQVPLIFIWAIVFIYYKKNKLKMDLRPLLIYLAWWLIWLLISSVNPYGLDEVSLYAYFLFMLHLIFFSLGFISVSRNNTVQKPKIYIDNSFISFKLLRIFVVINLGLLIIYWHYHNLYGGMLAQQSISDARNILFEQGQLFKTPYESLFYHVILGTILSITQLIVIVRWVSLKIFDRLTILALINTYLVSTIGLGRFILFYFILFYAMTSIFHRFLGLTTNKQSSKFFFMNIKRLILSASLLIIGTLAIVWTTLQRFGLNKIDLSIIPLAFELIVEQLVIYFTGCFRAFDQYLNSEYFKYIYGMGRATFGGIGEGINYFILISVDHGSRSMTNQLESYAFNQINIGNGHLYNAFYTCLMPYHVDGGVVGIMLFSGIFGWVFGKLYRNYRKNSSSWDLLILVYFSVTMILGLLRYQFLGLVPWLVLVGLYLMRYYSNRFNRCNIV